MRYLKTTVTQIPWSSFVHNKYFDREHRGVAATVTTVLHARFPQCSLSAVILIFSTQQLLWQKLAFLVNEFWDTLTTKQIENKWKSLEKGYKDANKNNMSTGQGTKPCEFESRVFVVDILLDL